jgi:hypothetical protein
VAPDNTTSEVASRNAGPEDNIAPWEGFASADVLLADFSRAVNAWLLDRRFGPLQSTLEKPRLPILAT